MNKNAINFELGFPHKYVDLVEEMPLMDAMKFNLQKLKQLDRQVYINLGNKIYAPGKWTVKEIFQHLLDWERVFCYRSLVFARRLNEIPPGHDENEMAVYSKTKLKTVNSILDEYILLRESTISLFNSFEEDDLKHVGKSFNSEMSALALGFILIGHQIHHFKIIEERYFPLI